MWNVYLGYFVCFIHDKKPPPKKTAPPTLLAINHFKLDIESQL